MISDSQLVGNSCLLLLQDTRHSSLSQRGTSGSEIESSHMATWSTSLVRVKRYPSLVLQIPRCSSWQGNHSVNRSLTMVRSSWTPRERSKRRYQTTIVENSDNSKKNHPERSGIFRFFFLSSWTCFRVYHVTFVTKSNKSPEGNKNSLKYSLCSSIFCFSSSLENFPCFLVFDGKIFGQFVPLRLPFSIFIRIPKKKQSLFGYRT